MWLKLERTDPAVGAWRWYTLSVEPDLFGSFLLVREWGRIGARGGGRCMEAHGDRTAAQTALERWRRTKARRGYTTVAQERQAEPCS